MDEERLLDAACKLGLRLQVLKARSDARAGRYPSRQTLSDQFVPFAGLAKSPTVEALDQWKRWHVRDALRAVTEFIATVPEWRGSSVPLEELSRVLANLERGRSLPDWLRKPGRRADSIEVECMRGEIAAIMELLFRSAPPAKFTREDAANFVVDHLPADALKRLLPASAHDKWNWRTIAEWRDSVIGNKPPSLRGTAFEMMAPLISTDADPQDRARELLNIVAQTITTTSE